MNWIQYIPLQHKSNNFIYSIELLLHTFLEVSNDVIILISDG